MGQLEDRLVASADLLQEGIVLERGFESCFCRESWLILFFNFIHFNE